MLRAEEGIANLHSRLDIVRLYLGSLGYEDLARVHEGASPVDNLGVRVGRNLRGT